ncbi:MAG: CoA-binding protein [Bacteroidota bacterium]
MNKNATLVLGATPNPDRYAHIATKRLLAAGEAVELVGIKRGEIDGIPIQNGRPKFDNIDTVTLYIGSRHLPEWADYIFELKPRRIIFNPGTEHPEIIAQAREKGIQAEIACTLVMLASHQYAL